MGDISKFALWCFATGHSYKKAIVPIDDSYIMDDELVVERNGDYRLHTPFCVDFANAHICDYHIFHPLALLGCSELIIRRRYRSFLPNSHNFCKKTLHFAKRGVPY